MPGNLMDGEVELSQLRKPRGPQFYPLLHLAYPFVFYLREPQPLSHTEIIERVFFYLQYT